MKNPLLNTLLEVLKQDTRFVSHEGELLKNTIRQKAEELDSELISLIIENEKLREEFFIDIKEYKVFNASKFIQFINNKEFLPDSYTSFKNKIGLTDKKGNYLAESNEVVLSFPYKDCVLVGGQDKEDSKRNEVFYNEILGRDEIDRLLDDKVFTNFKRIDKDGERELDGFKRDAEINKARGLPEDTITDNLIIKGNNLLALHSLKKNFVGKVKLIYIDPPYNTGNDSFGYNDRFNHSTWLTFMKNRLGVAKELLKDDGVIFVHCDNNEQAYLSILMNEIFVKNIETITVVNNPRGRDYGGIANMHEFINICGKSENYEIYPIVDESKKFPFEDNIGGFETRELRNRNVKFNDKNRPNLCYPFYINTEKQDENGFYEISLDKQEGFYELFPAKSQGIQTVWRWGKDKSKEGLNIHISGKSMKNGGFQIIERYRGDSRMARSVWFDKDVNSEKGTLHLKELFQAKVFDHAKPENTLNRVIEMATKKGDIVLDYHLGSGTTCSTAHKMARQYIGIEQMDYIETISVERMKKVTEGEQGGISKNVDWKGGGEFVYMEIMEQNGAYIERITGAKSSKELVSIWEEIKESGFVNYYVNTKSIDENIEEFKKLSIEDQKAFLMEIMDKNLVYMNYSEMNEMQNHITIDKALNNNFYK